MPGHQVHLHAELRHGEVVQHVLRAQQHLDRLVDRQVQLGARDQHVVAGPCGSLGVDAERVVRRRRARRRCAPSTPSSPGSRKLQCHCWPTASTIAASSGTVDELGPDEQPRRQHRGDADRGDDRQPPLELLVLGLVFRRCSRPCGGGSGRPQYAMNRLTATNTTPVTQKVSVHGVVHRRPVGGDRREPPGAQEVEHDGADDEQDQRRSQSPSRYSFC